MPKATTCSWVPAPTIAAATFWARLTLGAGIIAASWLTDAVLAVPPANDDCTGAIVIPDGPFPLVTTPVEITEATPIEVDDGFHPCAFGGGGADRTIWYKFTPSVSQGYVFSTCAGDGVTGAAGSNVYDTVIAVYATIGGACPEPDSLLSCNDTAPSCFTALPSAPYVDQSTTTAALLAGNTYYIVAGHWNEDLGGVGPGLNDIAIQVSLSPAPANDTCSNPTPLTLNHVTQGTTESATNDYRSDASAACFSGIGQQPTTSPGIDVVYSFLAPSAGKYNFRYVQDDLAAALRSQNPTLYLSDVCPSPAPTGPVVPCIKAANRIIANGFANGNRSEEIDCVSLAAGEQVYLFFDDRTAGNLGGPLAVEVTDCTTETEPNDDIATANPYPGCSTRGAANSTTDVDFFDLGAPPAGSKVFVGIDAVATNDGDFELRITNPTDTLGYDDNDGTSWTSANAPVVGGVIADGQELYARVNKGSASAQLTASEPYHLYARIETGTAQNEVDTPPNASYYHGNHVTGGGFVKGIMATQADEDCFRFVAHEGDEIVVFSDNNPSRTGGPITNVWPILRDLRLGPPTASRFTGQVVRNIVTPSPGTLTGVTPSVTSEWFPYRARYSGLYMACFAPTQDINNTENPATGAYPLPYQGSISLNGGPVPAPASKVIDVGVTKTGPAGPVKTGDIIEYTITLTNNGNDIAEDVRLTDTLPPELTFISLLPNDGFGGNNVGCIALPAPGLNDDIVDCTNFSIAPGASTVYTLQVQVNNCIGAGHDVVNTASITTLSTDPDASNDSASWTFTTSEDDSCTDLLCDADGCFANACTINDHCVAGSCQSEPINCDDNSLCTDDSCDPTNSTGAPCIHDSSQLGDCCGDGNPCTNDACDPVLFCVFPPGPAGVACDDFNPCTNNESCDGYGECVDPITCSDGQPCTYDYADPSNGCTCVHELSFPGSRCDDGDGCTIDTTCDGQGGGVASCGGGTPITAPPETQDFAFSSSKDYFGWSPAAFATRYDVVRGTTIGLPVGPGGSDEVCFDDLAGNTLYDTEIPPLGVAYWYLSRGENSCGLGTYGTQSNGSPRVTAGCP